MPNDLLTVKEAAKKMGVSIYTIHRWIKNKNISGLRIPGTRKVYIKDSELESRLVGFKDFEVEKEN